MSINAKMLSAGLNLIALFLTLIVPNERTALSLMPVYVTSALWTMTFGEIKYNVISRIFLTVAIISCGVAAMVGFYCQLKFESNAFSHYMYYVNDDVAFFGGINFDYLGFCIFVGVTVFLLYAGEIGATMLQSRVARKQSGGSAVADKFKKAISLID